MITFGSPGVMAQLRRATLHDDAGIRELHLATLPEAEREVFAALSANLLAEATVPKTLTWVAETDGEIIGHVAFSPVTIGDGEPGRGYILSPLAVHPGAQRQRLGTRLVETGLAYLAERGVAVVFVYGDPDYYSRFGFEATLAEGYAAPYPLAYPFGWQARALAGSDALPSTGALTCVASLSDPALW
ncbi:MAG: N-acetyltransferase [Bacteroidota bacterium]